MSIIPHRSNKRAEPIKAEEFGSHVAKVIDAIQAGSFQPALEACSHFVERGVNDNFIQRKTAGGVKWALRKRRYKHPMLRDTLRLLNSVARHQTTVDSIKDVEDRKLERGTIVPYASVHNYGGVRMVQREYMDVPEKYLEACDTIIADYGLDLIFKV